MKNKKNTYLIVTMLCFVIATVFAFLYAFLDNREIRFISALCFTACAVICLKTFFEYLKEIGFGKRLFGGFLKALANIKKIISDKLSVILGKSEDRIYASGKKDEFQIKFEFFKAPPQRKHKKSAPKLPKYSTVKERKDKIRYIYTVFLKRKIDRGYKLDVSRTPDEISEDFAGNEKTDMLFSSYPVARYANDDEAIDVETVKKLEDLL